MMRVSKLRKLSLTVGLAVLMAAAVPSAQMTPAEAAWSATDAKYHFYKTPSDNQRLFIMAVKQGDCDTVKSMLAAGVDVNGVYAESVSHAGYTGLWWAIRNDKREVAQLLLENKADVNGYYEFNGKYRAYLVEVAFGIGRDDRRLDWIKYLHNWGANINSVSDIMLIGGGLGAIKENALNVIVDKDYWNYNNQDLEIAKYLIDNHIDINHRNSDEETPFLRAAKWAFYPMLDLLAERGADIQAKDKDGRNALQIAIDKDNLKLYKHLQTIMAKGQQASNSIPTEQNGMSNALTPAQLARRTQRRNAYLTYQNSVKKYWGSCKELMKQGDAHHDALMAAVKKGDESAIKEASGKLAADADQMAKLRSKMEKVDVLKGITGCTVGEREQFSELFEDMKTDVEYQEKFYRALSVYPITDASLNDVKTYMDKLDALEKKIQENGARIDKAFR